MHRSQAPASRLVLAVAAIIAVTVLAGTGFAPASTGQYFTVTGHVSLGSPGVAAGAGDVEVGWGAVTSNPDPSDEAATDAAGNYSLTLPAGTGFGIRFRYTGTGGFLSPWWTPNASASGQYASYVGEAATVSIPSSSPTVADITLPAPASVSGTLSRSPGLAHTPQPSVVLTRNTSLNQGLNPYYHPDQGYANLNPDGSYTVTGLYPGTYTGEFGSDEGIGLTSTWAHLGSTATNPTENDSVVVKAGQAVTGANGYSFLGAAIHGNVSCPGCKAGGVTRSGPDTEWLQVWRQDKGGGFALYLDGTRGLVPRLAGDAYATLPLPPGTYRLQLRGGAVGYAISQPITVAAGDWIDQPLTLALPPTTRLAGDDRFATSVAISRNALDPSKAFSPGVPAVYIANGYNFPDALSAGPAAAAQHAPLLLVASTAIPASIESELVRLKPKTIVIVGGTATVSAAVQSQLQKYVPAPPDVVRVAGPDRFATSRAIAAYAFPHGAQTAYVATAATFPDALSAGSAAASAGGPLLIVDGSASAADAATRAALSSLHATKILVAGGEAAVTAGVTDSLGRLPGVTVTRLAGRDRYETSESVVGNAFDEVSPTTGYAHTSAFAFLALGTNFPDALSGGALAGVLGAPLYVTPSSCVPATIISQLSDLEVSTVVLLGGTSALGVPVSTLTECG